MGFMEKRKRNKAARAKAKGRCREPVGNGTRTSSASTVGEMVTSQQHGWEKMSEESSVTIDGTHDRSTW